MRDGRGSGSPPTSNARSVQHRAQYQVRVVEREARGRQVLPRAAVDIELPFEQASAREPEIDARVPVEIFQALRKPVRRHVRRRRAERHLHRNQLAGDDAGILDAPVAERHVDPLGHRPIGRSSSSRSMSMSGYASVNLASSGATIFLPKPTAELMRMRRAAAPPQLEHVVHGFHDLRDALMAVLVEAPALARQFGRARGSLEQPRAQLRLELLDVPAHGRPPDAEPFGGLGEAALARHGNECQDARITRAKARRQGIGATGGCAARRTPMVPNDSFSAAPMPIIPIARDPRAPANRHMCERESASRQPRVEADAAESRIPERHQRGFSTRPP